MKKAKKASTTPTAPPALCVDPGWDLGLDLEWDLGLDWDLGLELDVAAHLGRELAQVLGKDPQSDFPADPSDYNALDFDFDSRSPSTEPQLQGFSQTVFVN
jgi:hypothetical protein